MSEKRSPRHAQANHPAHCHTFVTYVMGHNMLSSLCSTMNLPSPALLTLGSCTTTTARALSRDYLCPWNPSLAYVPRVAATECAAEHPTTVFNSIISCSSSWPSMSRRWFDMASTILKPLVSLISCLLAPPVAFNFHLNLFQQTGDDAEPLSIWSSDVHMRSYVCTFLFNAKWSRCLHSRILNLGDGPPYREADFS